MYNEEEPVCRICFAGPDYGPLYQACSCQGTLRWMHLSCLNSWVTATSSTSCELCHSSYSAPVTFEWWKFWNDPVFDFDERSHYSIFPLISCILSELISERPLPWSNILYSIALYYMTFLGIAVPFTLARNLLMLWSLRSSHHYQCYRSPDTSHH